MIKRAPRQGRGRLRLPKNFQTTNPAVGYTAVGAGGSVTLTTNIPIVLSSNSPAGMSFVGGTLTTLTSPDPFHIDIVGAGSLSIAGTLIVGPAVGSVRGQNGGLLAAGMVIL